METESKTEKIPRKMQDLKNLKTAEAYLKGSLYKLMRVRAPYGDVYKNNVDNIK